MQRRKKSYTNKNEYAEYLRGEKWKAKREKVLHRFKFTCAKCGRKNTRFNVHHLTYDHIYNERLFELILLCEDCHSAIHAHKPKAGRNKIKALLLANKTNKKLLSLLLNLYY